MPLVAFKQENFYTPWCDSGKEAQSDEGMGMKAKRVIQKGRMEIQMEGEMHEFWMLRVLCHCDLIPEKKNLKEDSV